MVVNEYDDDDDDDDDGWGRARRRAVDQVVGGKLHLEPTLQTATA